MLLVLAFIRQLLCCCPAQKRCALDSVIINCWPAAFDHLPICVQNLFASLHFNRDRTAPLVWWNPNQLRICGYDDAKGIALTISRRQRGPDLFIFCFSWQFWRNQSTELGGQSQKKKKRVTRPPFLTHRFLLHKKKKKKIVTHWVTRRELLSCRAAALTIQRHIIIQPKCQLVFFLRRAIFLALASFVPAE